jgi:hypothetical protein
MVSPVKHTRQACISFSHPRTAFSVSISLSYNCSEWKRLLYFLFWMIPLDEPIEVKSVKSQFTKSYHKGRRMNNDGRDQLWFNLDKRSQV